MKKPLFLCAFVLALAACGGTATPTPPVGGGETASPPPVEPSATPEQPTATPIPLAAVVNGQPIFLPDYETEVARYETAATSLGRDLTQDTDYRIRVLDALIEKALILQAAQAAGLTVPDSEVQAAYDAVVAERGGPEAFEAWLAANLYTPESFRLELRDGMLANLVQTQVAAQVPSEIEQVHARHILVATKEEADTILADLQAGADFATLAVNQSLDASRINGGDLGWFPLGGLTQPEVAQAAFGLEAEQFGGPVESALGFHVVQTLERGVRPLSQTALAQLRAQAVAQWRAGLWASAQIEKFVP